MERRYAAFSLWRRVPLLYAASIPVTGLAGIIGSLSTEGLDTIITNVQDIFGGRGESQTVC